MLEKCVKFHGFCSTLGTLHWKTQFTKAKANVLIFPMADAPEAWDGVDMDVAGMEIADVVMPEVPSDPT